jgi:hypothetical protein
MVTRLVVTAFLVAIVVLADSVLSTTDGCKFPWLLRDGAVVLHVAVRVRNTSTAQGCGLTALKSISQKDAILVQVPASLVISANTSEELAVRVAQLSAEHKSSASVERGPNTTVRYAAWIVERLTATPPLLPGLHIPTDVSKVCLGGHWQELVAHAKAELKRVRKVAKALHSTANRSTLNAAWAAVRTRALQGPTDANAPEATTQFLAPGLDFANSPSTPTEKPRARVEYKRTRETTIDGTRGTGLDVLLTNPEEIPKGEAITLNYGNIRHPMDALDTYGFLPLDEANGAVRWDGDVPLQMGFAKRKPSPTGAKDVFASKGCRDANALQFNATSGRPADRVVRCIGLQFEKEMGQDTLAALPKAERRKVLASIFKILAEHANRTRRSHYAPLTEEGSRRCSDAVARVPDARRAALQQTLELAWKAEQFMRDAYDNLARFAASRVPGQSERPPGETEQAEVGRKDEL